MPTRRFVFSILSLKGALFCALAFLLVFDFPCSALDPQKLLRQFTHSSWSGREGLPGPVRAITQTNDGYLWLATETGLFRFDGIHFVLWEPESGEQLPGSAVQSLCLARDGSLWVGFRNGAISRVRNGQLQNYLPAQGFPRGKILSLAEDDRGVIWAAGQYTFGRIENGSWHTTGSSEGYLAPAAQAVFADSRGNVWVATDGYNFTSKRDTPQRNTVLVLHRGERSFEPTGVALSFVTKIMETPDKQIWVTQEDEPSVITIDSETGRLGSITGLFNLPLSVLIDHEKSVWVGLAGEGLRRLSDSRNLRKSAVDRFLAAEGFSGSVVYSLFEDREGNIWAGTEGGLDRFSDNKITPWVEVKDFDPGRQLGLASSRDGSLWVYEYSDQQLYSYYEGKVNKATWPASAPKQRSILSIYPDGSRRAWVGGDFGLAHVIDGKFSFLPIGNNLKGGPVEAIGEGGDGSLWISFWGPDSVERPMRYLHGVWTDFRKYWKLLPKFRCRVLKGDSAGRIWLGYEDGEVAVFEDGDFHIYSSHDGLNGGQINAIYEDSRGQVWIAADGGLSRFHRDGFTSVGAKSGLPGRSLSGILEDKEGSFWLAGSTGILKVGAERLNRAFDSAGTRIEGSFLDAGDGLRAMPRQKEPFPVAARTSDGRLWFSTTAGVVTLDLSRLPENRVVPPVVIEQLKADDYLLTGSKIANPVLRSNTKDVRFNYAALSLTVPERIRFRYKLEGFDADWSEPVSERQATYTNLPPRSYRFRVIASNNDGLWNSEGATLQFSIAPAFYQEKWFLLVCFAAVGFLAWLASQWHVRQVHERMQLQMEERLSERARIARDLHDTLLQSFQGLLLKFQRARNFLPGRPEEAMQLLETALDRGERAIMDGRDAIHDIRGSDPGHRELATEISELGEELTSDPGTAGSPSFRVVIEGGPKAIRSVVQEEIFRLASEALRNAYAHAHAKNIEAEIRYEDNLFRLRIRDDGIGIHHEHLGEDGRVGHYGLRGMRERAAQMGAQLDLWTEEKAGTEVELIVPGKIAYKGEVENEVANK